MPEKKTIVIASYTSWYHSLGVSSYLAANQIKPDYSILIANEFFDRTRSLDDTPLKHRLSDFTLVKSYGEIDMEVKRLPKNIKVYVLSTSAFPFRLTAALRKRSIPYELVVIEEGIGSYSSAFGLLKAKLRESRLSLLRKIPFTITLIAKATFKFLVFSNKKKCFWYNFERSGLSINKAVVDSYRDELRLWCTGGLNRNKSAKNYLRNCILLVGAPLSELNLVSERIFIDGIKSAAPIHGKKYVKPHPIEDILKYNGSGFEIFSSDLPFEVLMGELDASVAIYSFSSTCCYTSYLFFCRKVCRVKDIDILYDKLSRRQKKIINMVS